LNIKLNNRLNNHVIRKRDRDNDYIQNQQSSPESSKKRKIIVMTEMFMKGKSLST